MVKRVLVTGGTGYLGGVLVKTLSKEYDVRVLVRKSSSIPFGQMKNVQVVTGDVCDRSSLKEAVRGCDGIFHLAALVKGWVRNPSLFDEVNVAGFRNVAETAWEEKVSRLIYTSSFLAVGSTESSSEKDPGNLYALSKKKALALARQYQKEGYPLVTVIPAVLYGPGAWTEGNHVSRFLRSLWEGNFPGWFDQGKWRWNFAYVEDVARGEALAFEKGRIGEEYPLGGEVVSLRDFFTLAAELFRRPVPRRNIPEFFLWIRALCEEGMALAFGREPTLSRGILATYRHDWALSDEKARRELGYTTTPLREALAETGRWIQETR